MGRTKNGNATRGDRVKCPFGDVSEMDKWKKGEKMQYRKKKIIEKIVKKNYNNELEEILENKHFEEYVKSTLLSILYKIEASYKDV